MAKKRKSGDGLLLYNYIKDNLIHQTGCARRGGHDPSWFHYYFRKHIITAENKRYIARELLQVKEGEIWIT